MLHVYFAFLPEHKTYLAAMILGPGAAMHEAFQRESATILSVLLLVLARDSISSEMVDNTNGLISMRAYLTSLFFIDKVVIAD